MSKHDKKRLRKPNISKFQDIFHFPYINFVSKREYQKHLSKRIMVKLSCCHELTVITHANWSFVNFRSVQQIAISSLDPIVCNCFIYQVIMSEDVLLSAIELAVKSVKLQRTAINSKYFNLVQNECLRKSKNKSHTSKRSSLSKSLSIGGHDFWWNHRLIDRSVQIASVNIDRYHIIVLVRRWFTFHCSTKQNISNWIGKFVQHLYAVCCKSWVHCTGVYYKSCIFTISKEPFDFLLTISLFLSYFFDRFRTHTHIQIQIQIHTLTHRYRIDYYFSFNSYAQFFLL